MKNNDPIFSPATNLILSLIAFAILFSFVYPFIKTSTLKTDKQINKTAQAGFVPSNDLVTEQAISEVPDDGVAHILYKSNWQVIKCKVIHVSNSYTSHVVWVESLPTTLNSGGEIKDLSTH